MSTKIILKKSGTSGGAPLGTDLEAGEIALNLADRKIYTKNGAGVITRLDGAYVDSVAPANAVEGDLWFDTAANLLKAHNGSSFQSAGYQTIAALEDTTITAVSAGEVLKWSGSNWINNTLAEADIQAASNLVTDARNSVSVTDNGGDGSLSYNSTTGVISYTGPSAAEARAHFTGGTGIDITSGDVSIDFTEFNTTSIVEGSNLFYTTARFDTRLATKTTDDLTEGLNLYYTDARFDTRLATKTTNDLAEGTDLYYTDARSRAAVSITDTGGDGSLTYNNTTGVVTYIGPSAAETRAHFTGGTGVTITNGNIAVGQPVGTTNNVTFNKVTTDLIEGGSVITIDPAGTGDATGTVVIAGSLTVQGTTTSINSNEVNIGDSIILLNSDETGVPSQNSGLEIERGTSANVQFIWNEADDAWDLGNETLQNVTIDGGVY
jgi:hypothetical protein